MSVERWTNVIIGSGEAGKYLAWHLGNLGQRTIVVERRWIGGQCPNVNCLPSKNEIWSAYVAHLVALEPRFGTRIRDATIDMGAVRQRKREMVDGLIQLHLARYKASGAELLLGEARLTSTHRVDVTVNAGGTRTIEAERLFLNLGTHATIPAIPGLADSQPLTNIEALELDRLPEHLVVIGGGYVGLELAQAYRRFGSKVTILHLEAQLLSREDPDVVAELQRILVAEGIETILSADVKRVEGCSGDRVRLVVETPGGERLVDASDILVAAGRTPNTSGIGLAEAGIALDASGYIRVNERLETTAPHVWALGECAGSPQFTHVSLDDFRVVRDNLAGGHRTTTGRLVPACLFTDPQVAHVGLTEREAQRGGIDVRVARLPMAAVLRTRTLDASVGFMKALVDAASDRILGFTMIGPEAGEVMAVVQMAMLTCAPYTALRDAIITHPTMAEGLNALFAAVS